MQCLKSYYGVNTAILQPPLSDDDINGSITQQVKSRPFDLKINRIIVTLFTRCCCLETNLFLSYSVLLTMYLI